MQQVLVDADGRAFRRRLIEEDSGVIGTLKLFSKAYKRTLGDEATKLAVVRNMFDARATDANVQVEGLLEENTNFRVLVQKLLAEESTDAGVTVEGLRLPSAVTLAPVLQNFPVLRYNPATLRYYFYEQRHRLAAARLLERNNSLFS
jgi:hypothetical protein